MLRIESLFTKEERSPSECDISGHGVDATTCGEEISLGTLDTEIATPA